jgi:site-specific DNA-methyltransferase (adenine-specific)
MGEPKIIEPNIKVSDITQWDIYSVSNYALSEVYLMDCIAGMKHYPDKYFDLAVVDPPYGVEIETSGTYFKKFKTKGWDLSIPEMQYFIELFRVSKNQIVWGGNYFLDYLPNTKCFIIWDKMISEGMSFADAELAWTSFNKPTRIKKLLSINKDGKIHPTQKPIQLYEWILDKYTEKGMRILDTHLGSGSSRIAANKAGLDFVGFEIDEDYFNASEERFKKFVSQTRLF